MSNRTKILTASTDCIAKFGIRGLRVNDVAREAGVSSGLLYYHFTDRAGLLAATLDFINARASETENTRAAESPSDLTPVHRLLLDEIQENAEVRKNSVAWNELRSAAVFEADIAESLSQTIDRWNHTVALAVCRLREPDATEPSADDLAIAETLTSLVEGLSGRWLSDTISADHARALLTAAISSLLTLPPVGNRVATQNRV